MVCNWSINSSCVSHFQFIPSDCGPDKVTIPRTTFLKINLSIDTWRRRQWHPTPVLLPGQSHGQRNLEGCSPWGHTGLSDFTFTFMTWRRKWQPTPVFLPGESHRQGSLVGCRLWGRTELDTTEATQQQQHRHMVLVVSLENVNTKTKKLSSLYH